MNEEASKQMFRRFELTNLQLWSRHPGVGQILKLPLLLLLLVPICAGAQSPTKVALCDLVRQPEKFTRQWVEVRGEVDLAFENFSLRTVDCGEKLQGIWLAYGGDEPTPTASTVNDNERPPGMVLKVNGIPVPLQRDADLELFKRRLDALRVTAPDGSPCYEGCRLYRVTATLAGLFMAAPNPTNNPLSGYGHLGCCHLLAIQRVADVNAVRTGIPAGGKFACSTDTWDMNAAEADEALADRTCANVAACLRPFGILAQHWGDKVDLSQPSELSFSSGSPDWRSADLLTTYRLQAHYSDQRDGTNVILGATATRTVCKPIEPPYPLATAIGCNSLFSEFQPDKKHNNPKETWLGEPGKIAPLALEEAARHWGITLMPGVALQGCDKPMVVGGKQFTWCSFAEPTSMQSLRIELSRSQSFHQVRGWKNVPWTLTRGDGLSCVAEK
jgi:hypothetical protein